MKKLCACGCGLSFFEGHTTKGVPKRFIQGHNKAHFIDGRTKMPEYKSYRHAKARCNTPTDPDYRRYGGRGIRFLYIDFSQFLVDVGLRPTNKHSIDRKNNNGNYEPGNCKWSTAKEQARNRKHGFPRKDLTTGRFLSGIVKLEGLSAT